MSPVYDFECANGHRKEDVRASMDTEEVPCEVCDEPMKRQMPSSFRLFVQGGTPKHHASGPLDAEPVEGPIYGDD